MIIEPSSLPSSTWNVCIVGTGPVGMALALEFERLGRDVLLIESGGMDVDKEIADASNAIVVDDRRHAPMALTVCRALGGTSWTWGGRCVPYDDVDFFCRDAVQGVNWPISHDEIRPWYSVAANYLFCGGDRFSAPCPRKLNDGITVDCLERWTINPRIIEMVRDRLLRSSSIRIALNTTLAGIHLSADGSRVESLGVVTPAGPASIVSRRTILAAGGVESTRLLLHFQQSYPGHFGGVDGPLGRYYMGHISGKIATIQFDRPDEAADFDFLRDTDGSYFRRRFMLTAAAQLENKLLNAAFWPDNPHFYDPGHRSGVLSAVFLALAFPPTGRLLLPEAIRRAHTGPRPYKLAQHLRNVVFGAPRAAFDICRILRDRFLRKPRKPGFLVPNKGGEYALLYHAEQIPNPESRIRLSKEKDAFGVPRALIDLQFTGQDVDSVLRSHIVLDRSLRTNGVGRLKFWYPENALRKAVWDQASDGYHQIGSARMGLDPAQSVVDANLKVHGLDNFYVASSAAFPTSGQANSTMLAVAFAMRLAHQLAAEPAAS
jgi:choline dehydrogenase-like flavoprotein